MHAPLRSLTTVLALLCPSLPALAGEPPQEPDARALFLTNCASCHGEDGDGKGTTELDRPARSFRAGGFSFGNTPEAIFRTITHGIPGSPMASFATALSDEERMSLAQYVISLGPGLPPPPENSELVVGTRPVVVRGMLPPLTSSAVLQPRALAIGLPSGMSFEYRTDDVRLLGIRQGRFIDRTDWTGRGGTPLAPLGQVVYTLNGGNPGTMFSSPAGPSLEPMLARFRGTFVRDGVDAGLRYSLRNQAGADLVEVEESCAAVSGTSASGFSRALGITSQGPTGLLHFHAFDDPHGAWTLLAAKGADSTTGALRLREDGRLDLVALRGASRLDVVTGHGLAATLLVSTEPLAVSATTLISHEPAPDDPDARLEFAQKMMAEVSR